MNAGMRPRVIGRSSSSYEALRRRDAALPLLFAGIALVLFARSLSAGFVADDWEFFLLIDDNPSLGVVLQPLVERYVRPLVVLFYWIFYKVFGFWTVPYHVGLVLVHALNAFLLTRLVQLMLPEGERSTAFGAGMLFLTFAGHSEAVTWIGGMADVLLMPFAVGTLILFARVAQRDRPMLWGVVACLLCAASLATKETSVIVPALAAAWSAFLFIRAGGFRTDTGRAILRRSAMFLGVAGSITLAYIAWRTMLFGNPFDAYAGLETSGGMRFQHGRAFFLRAFFPPFSPLAALWARNLDIPLIAIGVGIATLAAWMQPLVRLPMAFAASALVVALVPALPLTISLATTETERVTYIPTAFASVVIILAVRGLLSSATLRWAVIGVLCLGHSVILQRLNDRWVTAGQVFATTVSGFVAQARAHDPGPTGYFFALNMPDNLKGAYVFRRGFVAALRFAAPDLETRAGHIVVVSSHTLTTERDRLYVTRTGPSAVSVDVSPNTFLQAAAPERPFYHFTSWTRTGYALTFSPVVPSAAVLFLTEGRIQHLMDLRGPGAPFGAVDIPRDGADCTGVVRFSGWALDDIGVRQVFLRGRDGRRLGAATWARNTRPDVAAAYPGFPDVGRAEWNYYLDCSAIGPGGSLEIVATDDAAHETVLGTRTVGIVR